MTPLSPRGSPIPALCTLSKGLSPAAKQKLDEKLYPCLASRVAEYFWDAVGHLTLILKELPFTAESFHAKEESRSIVLGHIRELMHEVSALKEYLGDVLTEILPREGKKSKKAEQVKARLEHVISFLYKAPINLVKHERFKLYWLEQSNSTGNTSGFVVTGMIAPGTKGPANYRTKNVAEGYSFALLLRTTLPAIFELCTIAATALCESNLMPTITEDTTPDANADLHLSQLTSLLEGLSCLPCRGFPNEVGTRVAKLSLHEQQLMVDRTFKLQGFGSRWTVHFMLPAGNAGDIFQIPYWVHREA